MDDINLIEIAKIKLVPGELLFVKLIGDRYSAEDLHALKAVLDPMFPDNKVFVTTLPTDHDMRFEVVSTVAKSSACADCACGRG